MRTYTVTVEFEDALLKVDCEISGETTADWVESTITCEGDIKEVLVGIAAQERWRGYDALMDLVADKLVEEGQVRR